MPGVTIDRDLLVAVTTIMRENIYGPDLLRSRRDRLQRFYEMVAIGLNGGDTSEDSEHTVTECPRCRVPLDKCPECGDSPADAALDPDPEGDDEDEDLAPCGAWHCTTCDNSPWYEGGDGSDGWT